MRLRSVLAEFMRECTNKTKYVKNVSSSPLHLDPTHLYTVNSGLLSCACVCVRETDGSGVTNDSAFIH